MLHGLPSSNSPQLPVLLFWLPPHPYGSLLSPLILKEKINLRVGIYLGIALLGSVVVTFSKSYAITNGSLTCAIPATLKGGGNLLGNALALLGAFMAAGYVISGRNLRKSIKSHAIYSFSVFYWFGCTAYIVFFVQISFGWFLSPELYLANFIGNCSPDIRSYNSKLGSGIYSGCICLDRITWRTSGFKPSCLGFFKRTPSLIEITGGIIILLGIILSSRLMNKTKNGLSDGK